jgi:hypothetical protein
MIFSKILRNNKRQQHQLLGGISFQIDNMTFSHHLASFNGIQDAERRVITSPEDDASYRIVGHASRACTSQRTWGGRQVIKKEFNKISKLGYIEHVVEFVYTEDGIV